MNAKLRTKKLITESDMHEYDLIKESTSDGANILKLSGPFAMVETLNNNNRMYHMQEMIEECNKFQEVIKAGKACAELEHPDDININPDRVCARITKFYQDPHDEKTFLGEAIIMQGDPKNGVPGTPCGQIVGSMLQYGTKMGFSTRGLGNPEEDEDGNTYVGDYQLITIDLVFDPSIGRSCDASKESKAVNGILESIEYLVDSNNLVVESRVVENFKKSLKKLPNDAAERYIKLKGAVDSFLRGI